MEKRIQLNNVLVKKYEAYGYTIDEAECRYLAKTGCEESTDIMNGSTEEIKEAIEYSINHTLRVENDIPDIIEKIKYEDTNES